MKKVTFSGGNTARVVTFSGSDLPVQKFTYPTPIRVEMYAYPNVTIINDPALVQKVADLENLKPIEILKNVVAGDLTTADMPIDNLNRIGIIQQIDGADGDKVYYPNFTSTPDGRSAVFYSVLTAINNKIIIWPRPSEV